MTNTEKSMLKAMVKNKMTFEEIRDRLICSDATIRAYIKQFNPKKRKPTTT